MTDRLYIAPTPRKSMSRARRVRIFLRANGKCGLCGLQIHDGEKYEIEHDEALNLGGADDDANCYPVHVACHKPKTAADRTAIAKRNRIIDKGYAGKRPSKLSKEYRRAVLAKYVREREAT